MSVAAGATIVHAPITFAHENAIRFDYPMFSEVMTSEAFTKERQGVAVASG